MTNDALINGKVQYLKDDEREAAEKFHKSRIAFALIDDVIIFNENENDDRDHQHWLADDFSITPEEFETIPRGYITKGKIQLFVGSSFRCVDLHLLKVRHMLTIATKHEVKYPGIGYVIYNGVRVGNVGEIWPPEKTVLINIDHLRRLKGVAEKPLLPPPPGYFPNRSE